MHLLITLPVLIYRVKVSHGLYHDAEESGPCRAAEAQPSSRSAWGWRGSARPPGSRLVGRAELLPARS